MRDPELEPGAGNIDIIGLPNFDHCTQCGYLKEFPCSSIIHTNILRDSKLF